MADVDRGFEYTLEVVNSLPHHVAFRSNKWRRLREELRDLKPHTWLRVGVPEAITDPKKRESYCDRIRTSGAAAYQNAQDSSHPYRYPTRIERDEDRVAVAVFVGKEPKED